MTLGAGVTPSGAKTWPITTSGVPGSASPLMVLTELTVAGAAGVGGGPAQENNASDKKRIIPWLMAASQAQGSQRARFWLAGVKAHYVRRLRARSVNIY